MYVLSDNELIWSRRKYIKYDCNRDMKLEIIKIIDDNERLFLISCEELYIIG